MMKNIGKSLMIATVVLGLIVAGTTPVLAATTGSQSGTHTGIVNPTKEQPWYQQYQATPLKAKIDINYVPGYGVALWSAPVGGHVIPGKLLPHGSVWQTYEAVTINGKTWYNLGGNQWLATPYAHVYGATYPNTEIMDKSVVTIKYQPGYSIAVWSSPNNGHVLPGKSLKDGSSWQTYGYTNNGELWYDLGGHQWIQARYTK
jgi:hypothetical protein